ncbi:MAG: tRNA (guanosine(46)-N7)-methyltransferase TrmB [Lachnospiraceae bacterium]|nr:tRNA (guanosine(46)-N7)-methyltransferase TrmB [Lachnospiraceae bacterium]
MRLRNVTGSEKIIAASPYVVQEPKEMKNKWKELFGISNPIYIEIGMGKGQFITTMAKNNPNINFIGIEKYSSVLLRAIQKVEAEEIPNLRFLCIDAKEIVDFFGKEEIDKIYLNFSDPWPKDRHAKRRLPSKEFLERYDQILKTEGNLEFKTDNRDLFDFAVEQIPETKWKIDQITYDLHHNNEMNKGNVMTEYEQKFSSIGNPIHKYIISR